MNIKGINTINGLDNNSNGGGGDEKLKEPSYVPLQTPVEGDAENKEPASAEVKDGTSGTNPSFVCGNCGFNTQHKSEYNDHMEQAHGIAVRRTSVAEATQMDKVLGAFSRLCGHENKEVTEKEILEEMVKAGIGQDEGLRCIQSLQRNGQIYEKKPGRFLLTFPGMEGT